MFLARNLMRFLIIYPNYNLNCFSIQIYGYLLYQHRITMIRRRDPGHFGAFRPIARFLSFSELCSSVFNNNNGPTDPSSIMFYRHDRWSGCNIGTPLLRRFSQLYHP